MHSQLYLLWQCNFIEKLFSLFLFYGIFSAIASSTSSIIQSQVQAVSNSTQQSSQQNISTANNNHLMFSIKNDGSVASSSISATSTLGNIASDIVVTWWAWFE